MIRQSDRLSDGRVITYYGAEAFEIDAHDRRSLGERVPRGDLRYDVVADEWVAVAAHRNSRTFLPSVSECPLCPTVGEALTEIPAPDYQVAVFENRFPSFAGAPAVESSVRDPFMMRAANGHCDVVCFTSRHDGRFADLTTHQARLVIDAWADRTATLSSMDGIEQVFIFENRGEAIGVTLQHPHGQIYGYPFITPRTRQQLEVAHRHQAATGRNLFEDVVSAEIADDVRVIARTPMWTAFVPFAARWPIEVHVYPQRRVPDFAALSTEEKDDLAGMYLDVLGRLDKLYESPVPYIAAWHQAPTKAHRDVAALHLELFSVQRGPGRLKYLAASESAMGAFVNDHSPEEVAHRLREVA